jgi:ribose-phosphate pyrophosphokinase
MILLDHKVVDINHFPDGTLHISVPGSGYSKHSITWKYESDEELFTLICVVKHLRSIIENCDLVLNMPYIPHARMDRVKKKSDVFTLKYFAQIINDLNFSEVWVFDPHSYVSEALIERIRHYSVDAFIQTVIDTVRPDLLFYPDEGAMKRYSSMIQMPYAFGIKKRDWETGKIEGLDVAGSVESISGKNILIVDDICSRGGTFLHSARKLKELGANKIYLYVSHCENTILTGELLEGDLVEKVFTTNSIFTKSHKKIEVFEI